MRHALSYILETLKNLWGVGRAGANSLATIERKAMHGGGMESKPSDLDVGRRLIGCFEFGHHVAPE